MRITDGRLLVLAFVVAAVGVLIITAYPATRMVVGAFVIGVLVCCIAWSWFDLYRGRNTTRRTVVCVWGVVWVTAAAAMWMGVEMVILRTLLCAAIANGIANVAYAIHLKRVEGF